MHFQHIYNNFLNVNPLNELVPKHILLSEKEGIEELNQQNCSKSTSKKKIDNFDRDPSLVDAQARWYGIKNQIVRIEGHSETSEAHHIELEIKSYVRFLIKLFRGISLIIFLLDKLLLNISI